MRKGEPAWNKGKSPSEEVRRKISESLKGRKLKDSTKQILSESHKGEKNPMYGRAPPNRGKKGLIVGHWMGKKLPEETKKKLSQSHLGQAPWNKGKQCESISQALKGEKHPNWQGGISFQPYCPKFNRALKEKIRERDNRTCQLCGIKENGRKLHVHHVHYDKPNCEPDLISLCNSCNIKVNFNRDYYENLFMQKLKECGLV